MNWMIEWWNANREIAFGWLVAAVFMGVGFELFAAITRAILKSYRK
jgi:hypothetical protein